MPTFTDHKGHVIEYADEAEVLDYCNRVREVGGADRIEALVPGHRSAAGSCMIARSLNFHCSVVPLGGKHTRWYIQWHGSDVRQKLDAAGLLDEGFLPQRIGMAAYAFDEGEGWTASLRDRER
jgi:hypothetical protein